MSETRASTQTERGARRTWTTAEENQLIVALKDLCVNGWKCQNGTFRPGYLQQLESSLKAAIPGCELRASPHIESKLKMWKKNYNSLFTMMATSGFGFNSSENRILVDGDDIWQDYMKKDRNAKGMREKAWPYFNDWGIIFGKDRATGEFAVDLEEMVGDAEIEASMHEADNMVGEEHG